MIFNFFSSVRFERKKQEIACLCFRENVTSASCAPLKRRELRNVFLFLWLASLTTKVVIHTFVCSILGKLIHL